MTKPKRRKRTEPVAVVEPTEAQLANGDYQLVHMPNPEGGNRVAPVFVNRGGTPVMRWIAAGKLSDTQQVAISVVLRLWRILGCEGRVAATYGEHMAPCTITETPELIERIVEAREDLKRIEGHFHGLDAWWEVFENVVRFDEPAGVSGSRLGFGARSAEDRAHTTVCFVADIIATRENLSPPVRIRTA